MILEDLVILLGKDESIYPVLNILITRATTKIKNYLNSNTYDSAYIEANFQDAITELVYNDYMNKDSGNILTKTQGPRTTTYKASTVTMDDSVKKLLPLPCIKMMG